MRNITGFGGPTDREDNSKRGGVKKTRFESEKTQDFIKNLLKSNRKKYEYYLDIMKEISNGHLIEKNKERLAEMFKDVKDKEFVEQLKEYIR